MTNDRVTSIDVAREAGVSQSAVSRVFSPSGSASAQTAQKVQKAAAKLGYRPNILARSLITGKTRIIGVIVAYLENHFYPEALEKLSYEWQQQGYHLLIFMASNQESDIDDVVQEILDYQVDGIITASVSLSSKLAAKIQKANIPIVMFNRTDDLTHANSVTSNNYQGGFDIAAHFIKSGHQKISYIAGWEGASTQRDREQGFTDGLAKYGRSLHSRAVGNYSHEQAVNAAHELLDQKERPDAIFVCNDHMAFAVMDIIRFSYGLRIPEDIAIIGYDDVPPASWGAYSLTTMRQSTDEMVEACVKTLLHSIQTNSTERKSVVIDSPLIIRNSTKPLIK